MKIRNGFVSNSSSSSFICEICGADESGYNMTYEDACMVSCQNGHLICREHLLCSDETFVEILNENDDAYYEFPEKYCPVCCGEAVSTSDLISYAKIKGLDTELMELVKKKGYHHFYDMKEKVRK